MQRPSPASFAAHFLVTAAAGLFAAARPAGAQEPLELARLGAEITLDGAVDEAAWAAVPPLAMVTLRPVAGAEPTQASDVRVAYDEAHLYVAAVLRDAAEPGGRVGSLSRDDLTGSDQLRVLLDTFDDNESGLLFAVNPAGVRWDASVSGDAEWRGAEPLNRAWNGVWDAAARRTPDGWSAELRIPFSSLRFTGEDGAVVMGLIVSRQVARTGEVAIFPAIPDQWDMAHAKPSMAAAIRMRGVEPAGEVRLTPYVAGGLSRSAAAAGAGGVFAEASREAGLDLKLPVTSDLTLDLTLNTDFAQAEADDQQVNLTRFSLFLPERRQFFLERSGIFDFDLGELSRLFHSRRIGLDGAGRPLRIYGGARIVGRVGGWDVGALDMQAAADDGTGTENLGVFRLRRGVLNEHSYVGGMLTTRLGARDAELAFGLDGTARVGRDDYLVAALATTPGDGAGPAEASFARLRFERRTNAGLGFNVEAARVGARFEPGLGFLPRNGHTLVKGWAGYGVQPEHGRPVRRFAPNLYAEAYFAAGGGGLESAFIEHFWNTDFRTGGWAWIGLRAEHQHVPRVFTLARDVEVPAGSYTFPGIGGGVQTPTGAPLRARVDFEIGDFYDGTRHSATLSPAWIVSPHLQLGADLQLNRVRFPGRDRTLDADVFRLRATAALDHRLSGGAVLQYNRAAGLLGGNLRLRYNFAEGTDLYVIYDHLSETGPLDAGLGERRLLFKYARAMVLGG